MIRQFIRNSGHSFRANKILTLITVLSLALGLMVFSIASLYVQRELGYDKAWPAAERIHRVVVEQRGLPGTPDGYNTSVDARSYFLMLDYFADQIEASTRLVSTAVQVQLEGVRTNISFLTFVDPAFADLFPLEEVDGSLRQVLENPGMIALSEARAVALGDMGHVGQRLLLNTPYSGGQQEFEVGAIVRAPTLTAHPIDMLTGIGEYASALYATAAPPWETSLPIRLVLKPGVDAGQINAKFPDFVDRVLATSDEALQAADIREKLLYTLQPIGDIYLNRKGSEEMLLVFGDKTRVITFGGIGLLVLGVGASNSASLGIANALRRRREVAIRKTAGATRRTLLWHYLAESIGLALAACSIALALQEVLLAPVMTLLEVGGELKPGQSDIVLLLAIAVLVGLVKGAYPAFLLSSLRPQLILKPEVMTGVGSVFRSRVFLVGAQFTLTIMFVASTLTLYFQLMVSQAQPLGYDYRNLLYFSHPPSSAAPDPLAVADRIAALPGVIAAMPMVTVPPNMNLPLNINAVNLVAGQDRTTEVQATRVMVTERFPDMLGIPLLAGRPLEMNRDGWAGMAPVGDIANALINRRAAEALGYAQPEAAVDQLVSLRQINPGGQAIDIPLQVVGVLEDNRYSSLQRRPVPEVYAVPSNVTVSQFMLRYDPELAPDIRQQVMSFYATYGIEPNMEFVEDRIDATWLRERNENRLLLVAATLALFLSCAGMYGLVTTAMVGSVKEVGIRKVMGATLACLLGLFVWRFSRPALWANLVAWPIAGWFVISWIQRFPDQLDMAWLVPIFLGASLIVVVISWLTIACATSRTVLRPPVDALRYE